MPHLPLTDLYVHPLCLGGNPFGWTADVDASHAVLDEYVELGGNFIDTADVYSAWKPGNVGGESESIIGRWIGKRGRRDDVVIATKVAKLESRPGLSAANITAALDDSLRRLGTDYVDIYYAHQDDPSIPLEETLTTFDALIRAGKVRYIAASQYEAPRLREAIATSRRLGLAHYIGLQTHYNLMTRDYEGTLQEACLDEGISCLPFYGLARGFLSGKYRDGVAVESVRAKQVLMDYGNDTGWRMVAALVDIAERHGVSPSAVALEWLRQQPGVSTPLASARSVEQLRELMQPVKLTSEDLATLTAIRP